MWESVTWNGWASRGHLSIGDVCRAAGPTGAQGVSVRAHGGKGPVREAPISFQHFVFSWLFSFVSLHPQNDIKGIYEFCILQVWNPQIKEVGNSRPMTIIQGSGTPPVLPYFAICQLSSKDVGNIMNKIIKIVSSVRYWEGLPEIGQCDLGFYLSGGCHLVSKVGGKHSSLRRYLWLEQTDGYNCVFKTPQHTKNRRTFLERR